MYKPATEITCWVKVMLSVYITIDYSLLYIYTLLRTIIHHF